MTQAKLITASTPQEFDNNLNEELGKLKKIKSVEFSTAITNNPEEKEGWDTMYSAIIIYEE